MQLSGTINDEQVIADTEGVILADPTEGRFIFLDKGVVKEIFNTANGLGDGNMLSDISVTIESERQKILRERFHSQPNSQQERVSGLKIVKAPMPGMVKSILITPGEKVAKNSVILILEAMKMENSISAGFEGTVKRILVETGNSIEKNAPICEIKVGK